MNLKAPVHFLQNIYIFGFGIFFNSRVFVPKVQLTSDRETELTNEHCYHNTDKRTIRLGWRFSTLPRYLCHRRSSSTLRLDSATYTETQQNRSTFASTNRNRSSSRPDFALTYLKIISVGRIAQQFPVYRERGHVSLFVIHDDDALAWHERAFRTDEPVWRLQRAQ